MRARGDGRLGAGLLVFLGGMAILGEARHRCYGADAPARSPWGPLRTVVAGAAMVLGLADAPARADGPDDRAVATLTPLGASLRRGADGRVTSLTLLAGTSKVTDADFACVEGLTGLRSVVLIEDGLTDASLARLAALPALQTLYLGGHHTDLQGVSRAGGTRLTDVGLVHVAKIKSLRRLVLAAPGFTDAGLAHVAGLSGLKSLGVSSPGFTDAGLIHLGGLAELDELNLSGSQVKGRGLGGLAVLPGLRSVVLGPGTLAASALGPLADLAALRRLTIYRATLADDAPPALGRLTRLESLDLVETPIARVRLARLNEALPKTQINVEPGARLHSAMPTKNP